VCEYLLFCLDSRVCTELIVVHRYVSVLVHRKHIFVTVIGASTFSVPVDATPVCVSDILAYFLLEHDVGIFTKHGVYKIHKVV